MSAFLRMTSRTRSSVHKWAVGAMLAAPTAAVIQGCLMLNDFRTNHGNAPHPVSPSRGVVVVSPHDIPADGEEEQKFVAQLPYAPVESAAPPIRLLVVGDSLSAGVGQSKSGTPVLPESIALSLSKALGGRPVYWTCVGTPGASASQIVRDLDSFDDTHKDDALKSRLQNRLAHREFQQQQGETEATTKFQKWWLGFRRDASNFRAVLQNRKKESVEVTEESVKQTHVVGRKGGARKNRPGWALRGGSDSPADGRYRYDIAVVFLGLNDLKESVLPWMNQTQIQNRGGGLDVELLRVVEALKSKMRLDLRNKRDHHNAIARIDRLRDGRASRRPLVVLPEMPASALPIFQYAPLSWFAVPLIQGVENIKKELSEKFPGSVLFVKSPSPSSLSDIEAGRGKIWAQTQTEEVLLKLTDVTIRTKNRVENLMAKHYQKWARKRLEDVESQNQEDKPRDAFEQGCHDHQWVQWKQLPGASLIAADKVHPTDEGYDFWGRHIANAIVQEWKK